MKTMHEILSQAPAASHDGPRAIAAINNAVYDLLNSSLPRQRKAASELEKLYNEARPFKVESRMTGLGNCPIQFEKDREGDLEVLVMLRFREGPDSRNEETEIPVHPAVAAGFHRNMLIKELTSALEEADQAGRWDLATAIGKALHTAYATTIDICKKNDASPAPPAARTFRLKDHNPSLAQNIETACEQLQDRLS